MQDAVLEWLLEGDASIRWQVLRDLSGSSERKWRGEQRRVASDGWGARLLAFQNADGRWTRGIYSPKWTSTTYTMVLLRNLGLASGHPQAIRACKVLLDAGFWTDGGINFWRKSHSRSETCVSGMLLAVLSWFGLDDPRVDRLAEHVVAQQMKDGGWNCLATPTYGSATHGSFHTTISALEGLMEYERFRGTKETRPSSARGQEFLLAHRLFRSHRTGKVAKAEFTRFPFPPRWHYDALRGLDYFREYEAPKDERLQDAIALVESRRARRAPADDRWTLPKGYPGKTFFEMETAGEPSRWNTLRAMRVLKWWDRPPGLSGPPGKRSNQMLSSSGTVIT